MKSIASKSHRIRIVVRTLHENTITFVNLAPRRCHNWRCAIAYGPGTQFCVCVKDTAHWHKGWHNTHFTVVYSSFNNHQISPVHRIMYDINQQQAPTHTHTWMRACALNNSVPYKNLYPNLLGACKFEFMLKTFESSLLGKTHFACSYSYRCESYALLSLWPEFVTDSR